MQGAGGFAQGTGEGRVGQRERRGRGEPSVLALEVRVHGSRWCAGGGKDAARRNKMEVLRAVDAVSGDGVLSREGVELTRMTRRLTGIATIDQRSFVQSQSPSTPRSINDLASNHSRSEEGLRREGAAEGDSESQHRRQPWKCCRARVPCAKRQSQLVANCVCGDQLAPSICDQLPKMQMNGQGSSPPNPHTHQPQPQVSSPLGLAYRFLCPENVPDEAQRITVEIHSVAYRLIVVLPGFNQSTM